MLRVAAILGILVHLASAEVAPLSKLRRQPDDTLSSCNYGFGMWNVNNVELVVRGRRAELQRLDEHGQASDTCRIPLQAIAHRGKLVVYAARLGDLLIVATPTDGSSSPDWEPSTVAGWIPLSNEQANAERMHEAGDPVQLIGALDKRSYVVTASVSQTWRDQEPLLAITMRWRSAVPAAK